jgi:HSP20 family protein
MSTATALAPLRSFRSLLAADPFRGMRGFNSLFDDGFGPMGERGEELNLGAWAPSCDIFETKNEIVVKAELPGVHKEDVKVNVENGILMIRGERKLEEETKREDYYRMERSYGEFARSFTLPTLVDANKITADFKHGVLRVTLPKREEAKSKAVEVTVK